MGRANALCTFILGYFWAKDGLKVLLKNPSILENSAVF
jgi:hypothetical protein